jgi:hypothetical protein
MEDVKRYKDGEYSVECTKGIIKLSDRDMIHNLCDTIEVQQQELADWQQRYEELDAGHSKLYKDFCEQREALKVVREALTYILNTYECGFDCQHCNNDKALCSHYREGEIISEALVKIAEIGGREDV